MPDDEYDWFNVRDGSEGKLARRPPLNAVAATEDGQLSPGAGADEQLDQSLTDAALSAATKPDAEPSGPAQKEFFEFAGPLYSVRVYPTSCVLGVSSSRTLRAVARDRERRTLDSALAFHWEFVDGSGSIENPEAQVVTFHSGAEPGLVKLHVAVMQDQVVCGAEAIVTVTASLLPQKPSDDTQPGIPGYTYQHAPGELWRSRYRSDLNVIVINNGHRDFVFAARNKALKLRYLCRLFAKELVYRNFPGYSPEQLLERLIELSLYTEENLR